MSMSQSDKPDPRTTRTTRAADHLPAITAEMQALIDAAPDHPIPPLGMPGATPQGRILTRATGFPAAYRPEWERPMLDTGWTAHLATAANRIRCGGILAMIGPRGTGKTRLAAEASRDFAPSKCRYATAMGVFLRLRRSYHAAAGKAATECEADIVDELATAPLLVLDEIQERGNTPWEDRILTHIIDRRYGDRVPTIIVANLSEAALVDSLGDSIVSRFHECGGVLELNGPSHRLVKLSHLH